MREAIIIMETDVGNITMTMGKIIAMRNVIPMITGKTMATENVITTPMGKITATRNAIITPMRKTTATGNVIITPMRKTMATGNAIPTPMRKDTATKNVIIMETAMNTAMVRNAHADVMTMIPMIITMQMRCFPAGDWKPRLPAIKQNWKKFWKNLPMEANMGTCFEPRGCCREKIQGNGTILTWCLRSMRFVLVRRIIRERSV